MQFCLRTHISSRCALLLLLPNISPVLFNTEISRKFRLDNNHSRHAMLSIYLISYGYKIGLHLGITNYDLRLTVLFFICDWKLVSFCMRLLSLSQQQVRYLILQARSLSKPAFSPLIFLMPALDLHSTARILPSVLATTKHTDDALYHLIHYALSWFHSSTRDWLLFNHVS